MTAAELRDEFRRAPRFNGQRYIYGFGGHARRWACKCTEADELICGRSHPDKHESPTQIERRRIGAMTAASRDVRTCSWRAELAGSGEERSHDLKHPYKRPSKMNPRDYADRVNRPLSDDESKQALAWMRKQQLPNRWEDARMDIASQAWLELRCPPPEAGSIGGVSFIDEVRRAWWRALKVIQGKVRSTV